MSDPPLRESLIAGSDAARSPGGPASCTEPRTHGHGTGRATPPESLSRSRCTQPGSRRTRPAPAPTDGRPPVVRCVARLRDMLPAGRGHRPLHRATSAQPRHGRLRSEVPTPLDGRRRPAARSSPSAGEVARSGTNRGQPLPLLPRPGSLGCRGQRSRACSDGIGRPWRLVVRRRPATGPRSSSAAAPPSLPQPR